MGDATGAIAEPPTEEATAEEAPVEETLGEATTEEAEPRRATPPRPCRRGRAREAARTTATGSSCTPIPATRTRSRRISSGASTRWACRTRSSACSFRWKTKSSSKTASARSRRRKCFPGYVLVEMIMDDQSWYVVRNTQGVTGFVGSPGPGEKPVPLQDKEVKTILKQMGIEAPKLKIDFKKGDRVKVTSGPFFDFTGVVDEIAPEKERLRALISIFGRETPVELEFFQVRKYKASTAS